MKWYNANLALKIWRRTRRRRRRKRNENEGKWYLMELITSGIHVDGNYVDRIMFYKLFTIGTYIFTCDINEILPFTCQKLLLICFTYKIFMFNITISRWNSAQFPAILFFRFWGVSNYLNWATEPFLCMVVVNLN